MTKAESSIYRTPLGRQAVLDWYETNLAKLVEPHESQYVETTHGKTHVLVMGPADAPPLVVLHGLGINVVGMQRSMLFFAKKYRVYGIDIIGQPGRSAEIRLPRKGTAYGEWLVEVLDRLGLEQASFFGLSFGGWMTMNLASVEPDRIQQAVLMVPAGLAPLRRRFVVHLASRALMFSLQPTKENLLRIMRPLFTPDTVPEGYLLELFDLMFRHCKPEVALMPVYDDELLARFDAPVMVFAAEYEAFFDPKKVLEHAKRIFPNLKAAHLVRGAGHIMTSQEFQSIHEQTLEFFDKNTTLPIDYV